MIGLYLVTTNKLDVNFLPIEITLAAITFIDPSTGWFEIVEVPSIDKRSTQVLHLFN